MSCYTRRAIDLSTCRSGPVVMWGWGGYLRVEMPNGSTRRLCFSTREWLGWLPQSVLARLSPFYTFFVLRIGIDILPLLLTV
jgi:hypothetical protein